ncbi:MAG: hypothetical protein IJR13_03365 [Bacteroidales bacterium]|nr:hypothetical protein [Bacteroidales bacterium]
MKKIVLIGGIFAIIIYVISSVIGKQEDDWRIQMEMKKQENRHKYGPPVENKNVRCHFCGGSKLCIWCDGCGWIQQGNLCPECIDGICKKCGGSGLN